ncbi:MAG: 50S ribosomal protein L25/general stress protein Ctc [Alphaproteobacteria bacterium]|nr:50S ribosomal protein L25/general stress protein Ctc [Alphaproteobacteria bacterium]
MVETVKLAAQPRERAGKGASRVVRREGRVPAVVYGEKQAPELVSLDPRDVVREMHKTGFFTRVFDIEVGGRAIRALARDVQFHPVTDKPEHVDFMRVSDTTRIRVAVPVRFANADKAPGIKRGGVLNVVAHDIEVFCTITTIPRMIEVDLAGLDINDSVHISSIKLPEGVKPTIARDFTVAAIGAPTVMKSDEEAAEAAARAAASAASAAAAAPADGAKPAAGAAPAAAAKPAAKK